MVTGESLTIPCALAIEYFVVDTDTAAGAGEQDSSITGRSILGGVLVTMGFLLLAADLSTVNLCFKRLLSKVYNGNESE